MIMEHTKLMQDQGRKKRAKRAKIKSEPTKSWSDVAQEIIEVLGHNVDVNKDVDYDDTEYIEIRPTKPYDSEPVIKILEREGFQFMSKVPYVDFRNGDVDVFMYYERPDDGAWARVIYKDSLFHPSEKKELVSVEVRAARPPWWVPVE